MTPAELSAAIEALAADVPDVVRGPDPGGATTWSLAGRPFAAVDESLAGGPAVELRLDGPIAAAALRTPDTSVSDRGAEWVRFAPATLDGYDLDRLEAWFGLASRRAAAGPGRT